MAGRAALGADFSWEQIAFFEKHVRGVFVEVCSKCHNADKHQGGLRLDSREGALRGGDSGPAIIPGKPEESELIKAIQYGPDGYQMPPKAKLPDGTIAALTEWVAMGAPWPDSQGNPPASEQAIPPNLAERAQQHWSFRPLEKAVPPSVKRETWVRNPIDRFILAELERRGLAPAAAADKRALIRRVTFDLIGLPPTTEQIDQFVADPSPQAFKKVVDRLLASPLYGERWARHWLDLVRYAETRGHEFDFDIFNAYEYRDYVVRALNADVPYDQFVLEHVAGDLLAEPRRNSAEGFNESIIGTGFFFLGEGTHSPVDIRKDEADRVDNQIDVFSRTFLGLSVACARCHDHKFDPIGTADYYALCGMLQSSRYQEAYLDSPDERRGIAQKLSGLRRENEAALTEWVGKGVEKASEEMPTYWLAHASLVHPSEALSAKFQQTGDGQSDRPDMVFEDFEGATYGGWIATGDAFGSGPNRQPFPTYQGDVGALGKGFVNSHSALVGGQRQTGDQLTGTLTSKPFTIDRHYIRFLIGGGSHAGKTCMNLHVDGEVVLSATGKNKNEMHAEQFDVGAFLGRQGHLEIVDQVAGGWGNIGLDHIVFTDHGQPDERSHRIAVVAREHQLDAKALRRWADALNPAGNTDDHDIIYPWKQLVLKEKPEGGEVFAEGSAKIRDRLSERLKVSDDAWAMASVFEDFGESEYVNWYTTGEAFGDGPTQKAEVLPAPGNRGGIPSIAPPGVAHSGRLTGKLRGVLRSETFTIEKSKILYRMAGDRSRVNLIIDGFQLIRDPIYGGLKIELKDKDRFEWYSQDVSKWVGHNAYIEFIDDGAGFIAVDQIVFSDKAAPGPSPNRLLVNMLDDASLTSPQALAAAYRKLFSETVDGWKKDGCASTGDSADRIDILNWVIDQGVPTFAGQESLLSFVESKKAFEREIRYGRRAMALADGTREDERIHIRGSHQQYGGAVRTRFLEALGGLNHEPIASGSGRLILAKHMVSEANPLLPRVMVNRIWQHHFGSGIVGSPDDFGVMGERPTHPALLDFLAGEFVQCGWSIKGMHRLMLLSSSYQMGSISNDAAEKADPENKLLHRMPVRRLEGETIRDAILAVSGRMDTTQGGPSVMPYLTPFMEGRGRPGQSGPLDGDGRRSLYLGIRRNFLSPLFMAFDAPVPFSTMGKRSTSNVPAQALTLMNNPFVVEQAKVWAERLLQNEREPIEHRITGMYLGAFGRPPLPEELAAAAEFVARAEKQDNAEGDRQAWADLCHVFLNVKEFIYIN
jgi:hypothetical protein